MREKIEIKDIILIVVILVVLCVNIIIYINKITPYYESNEESKVTNRIENNAAENQVSSNQFSNEKKLEDMSERERMEYYFSEFIGYIEAEQYQEAYNLLYPDFRNTYFQTLEDFKKYVNKTYPDFVSFSYNDIERQGYIYVLTITIINPDVNKDEAKKSQRIVIKENDFNDFVLSFQVI